MLTILYRPIYPGDLHPILAQLQWIDFSQHIGDFYANFSELIRTLDTDREYVHSHSQLLQRAIAWYQKKQNPDLLLRGSELAIAENWLTAAQRKQKQPPVSKLHRILRVQFSPNGQNIVAANTEGNLYILDANGGLLNSFSAHNNKIWALGFSPDSQMIVSGSDDRTIKLWNLDGKIQQFFSGHGDRIVDICFSPDGKILVSGSEDYTVIIWSLDGKFRHILSGHHSSIIGIQFSEDGKTLISVSSDGMVKFWNFDLDDLLTKGCDWLRDYLKTNPEVDETDRHLGMS